MLAFGYFGYWFGRPAPQDDEATATGNVAAAKASYAAVLNQVIAIRRYSGVAPSRTHADFPCRARVTGYAPEKLIGNIKQGDRLIILLVDDLTDAAFALPITDSDKAVVRGKELAIIAPDDSTRRIDDVLIAYELQVRGL